MPSPLQPHRRRPLLPLRILLCWLLLVASLDASHFGPGFFPLMISIFLIPLLALIFLFDLFMRIVEAILGKGASLRRRLVPVVVAAAGLTVYAGVCVIFIMQR